MMDDPRLEAWRGWRRSSEGLVWRIAVPEDQRAIERVWKAKARILGAKCELPDLFAPPIIMTLVAEDGRGRIVDGVFLEASVDVTKLGADPRAFRSLTSLHGELGSFLKHRRFRRVTAAMPKRVSEKMAAGLGCAGFDEQQQLVLWEKWL